MRHWGHQHSLAVGVAGGLILDRHVLVIATIFFLLGVAVAVAGRFLKAAKSVAVERGRELHDLVVAKQEAEIERKRAAAKLDEERAAHRSRTREEQRRAEEKAYTKGVADGAHS